MVPLLGVSSPAIMFMTVDLPQPDGPTTQMNSPVSMARVTPVTASVRLPVRGATNSLATSCNRSFGGEPVLMSGPPGNELALDDAEQAINQQRDQADHDHADDDAVEVDAV